MNYAKRWQEREIPGLANWGESMSWNHGRARMLTQDFPAWWWLFPTGRQVACFCDNLAWRLGVTMSFKDLSCNLSDLALNEWAQRECSCVCHLPQSQRLTFYREEPHILWLKLFFPIPKPLSTLRVHYLTYILFTTFFNLLPPSPDWALGSFSWLD